MSNEALQFLDSTLPHVTFEDKTILGNILGQASFNSMTRCLVWLGPVQRRNYPVFMHHKTNTLAIRPFIYRCFSDGYYEPKSHGYLKTSCGTSRCISPEHIIISRRAIRKKAEKYGSVRSRYGHIVRR